jgi:hypothetical protein
MDPSTLPSVSIQEYLALRNGYYRRLLNLNTQIRHDRKHKLSTKELNEKRKLVNKHYNLLDVHKDTPGSAQSVQLYHELLRIYKNE